MVGSCWNMHVHGGIVLLTSKEITIENTGAQSRLLLSVGDFHGPRWSNTESLQSFFCCSRLHFVFKLHKSNVWSAWNQTNLLESRKSVTRNSKVQRKKQKSKTCHLNHKFAHNWIFTKQTKRWTMRISFREISIKWVKHPDSYSSKLLCMVFDT